MNLKEIFFLLLVAIVSISAKRDRVRLKDVDTLTLYSDRWTTSRRSSPVKQLNCVGGHCNRVQIETAQCYNRGFDGNDVQWECKAELPSNYKFGRLEVSCEGYDYPDDDNILVGSCGLEYTIAEVSKTSDSYFPSSFPTYNNKNGDSGSTFLTILFVGGAVALFFYLRSSRTREQRGNSNGTRSSFNPSAPPPPGFRPDFYGSSDTSYGSSSTGNSHNPGTSDGPGFFSGMATGGILGYLFGSNRNNGYSRRDYQQSSYYSPPTSGYSSFGSLNRGSSGASTSTSTSTGYASTKRR